MLFYLSFPRGEDEDEDYLQPDPAVMILLLFDARSLCTVVVIANEAVVKFFLTRVAIVAAPLLYSS